MPASAPDRLRRKLDEAEGFLLLDLPEKALEILRSRDDWGGLTFRAEFCTGEALRSLGRWREALAPLEHASRLRPGDAGTAMALGWCYKRTSRLAQAIDALQRAQSENPDDPLLSYNLACYWSLARRPERAIPALVAALSINPDLHRRLAGEADFDPIRDHPEFRRLAGG